MVASRAPADYQDPLQFFARTCFTRALVDHCGRVLRRLAGRTENAPPVLTLITQFGGGKTHTLTALYHLARAGSGASAYQGVGEVLKDAGLDQAPKAQVGVFVGNAWDPQPGRETPWIDLARQIAGDAGVEALGPDARTAPPGTDALNRVIDLAGGPVLLLFDEVLNSLTRHKHLAEPMHAFIHNVMRGFIGQKGRAAVISLPRSQVEMTPFDQQWQDKITPPALREPRQGGRAQGGGKSLRGLVLRAPGAAPARGHCPRRGERRHGPRSPPRPVWASYRFVILADRSQPEGVAVIDLGAGHASANDSLTGRIVTALRSNALLNESPGAGYLDRRWPDAFKESGAWPLKSLRQAFLSGAMERLLDVDACLNAKIPEFVRRGDFGLASGAGPGGSYQHVWFEEEVAADEVSIDADVYLLTESKARALRTVPAASGIGVATPGSEALMPPVAPGISEAPPALPVPPPIAIGPVTLRVVGEVPFESWNRIGTKVLSKLKAAGVLSLTLDASVSLDSAQAAALRRELAAALQELGLEGRLRVE